MSIVSAFSSGSAWSRPTETTDWLIGELGLRRHAVARWGPMGTVLLSDTRAGRLRIQGYAGDTAPVHVDLLHAARSAADDGMTA